ncbi:MAG: Na/Pi symporter [Acidobacteriota bacterium]
MSDRLATRPEVTPPGPPRGRPVPTWLRVLLVLGLLYLFLTGVRGLGNGLEALGEDLLDYFFRATANPFVGLMVGILATTLLQSSSASTSLIVGLVAAPGNPLPVGAAIPMVMGANIGTTVTNTIVSVGHIPRPEEFRRAFGAATCHDFFNFLAVAILLPLEIATGFLERIAWYGARPLANAEGYRFPNPLKDATRILLEPVEGFLGAVIPAPRLAAVALILLSAAALFGALYLLVRSLRALAASRLEAIVGRTLDARPHMGFLVGIVVTIMVQSSSITTSILVPLAGAGIMTLHHVFPITLGANVGTTFTALMASLAAPAATAAAAIQVALAHLAFNLVATALIYLHPRTREVPIRMARWLADQAVRSRRYAVLYVLLLFYGIPAALIALSQLLP